MKKTTLLLLLLVGSLGVIAQPRYSPEVRSEREIKWMQDSIHVSPTQLEKIKSISLKYQQEMDKAADQPNKKKNQEKLMQKKDAQMRRLLNKPQYNRYIRREEMIRKQDTMVYKGRQPL